MIKYEELETRFTYHTPNENDIEFYRIIRSMAADFADHVNEFVADSREKSIAITKIEEAVMWANAARARRGEE